jgi:hypothetical protein
MVRDDDVAERYEERDVGTKGTEGSRNGAAHERVYEYRRRIAARIANHRRTPLSAIKRLVRTPDAFAAWLRDHPHEAVVGDAVTPDDAPLANFLWERLGMYFWVANAITDGERLVDIELPDWCRAYMLHEAAYFEQGRRDGGTELTAAEVLDVLQGVVGRA